MTLKDADLKAWNVQTAAALAIVVALAILAWGSVFVVQPTEMAGVRRLGTVRTAEPLGPGLYMKFPLIETVDRLQVSLDSFRIDNLKVYTIDNQSVTIGIGITYRIPREAVFKLLYQIGKSGNFDIERNLHQVIADRALRIFARRNTVKISEEREQIAADVRTAVAISVREFFGIEIADLQIPSILYSQTFVNSVEAAVKAKNDAIAAENTVNRIRFEGQQRVVTANAEAEAQIAKATAQKQAQILAAEGEARAIELKGQAEALSIRARGDAIRGQSNLIQLILAERWTGQPPQTIFGSQAAVPFFNITPQAETGERAPGTPAGAK